MLYYSITLNNNTHVNATPFYSCIIKLTVQYYHKQRQKIRCKWEKEENRNTSTIKGQSKHEEQSNK